jgi:two-component system, chemotaxis family, response regulator Rcp1
MSKDLSEATFVSGPPFYVGRPGEGSFNSFQPDLYGESASEANRPYILLVEDNSADIFLTKSAIREFVSSATVEVLRDGQEAILFCDRAESDATVRCPDLIVMDLNLPKAEGRNVLAYLRRSRRFQGIPVIVASSSNSPKDRGALLSLGANAYFHKPSDYDAFLMLGEVIRSLLPRGSASPGELPD